MVYIRAQSQTRRPRRSAKDNDEGELPCAAMRQHRDHYEFTEDFDRRVRKKVHFAIRKIAENCVLQKRTLFIS